MLVHYVKRWVGWALHGNVARSVPIRPLTSWSLRAGVSLWHDLHGASNFGLAAPGQVMDRHTAQHPDGDAQVHLH